MKMIITFAAVFALSTTVSYAKSLPQGASPISDAEQIEIFAGKKLDGVFYNKEGKKGGSFTVYFRNGGTKEVSSTPNNKKTKKTNLKWYVKDGKFCDQRLSTRKFVCGTEGLIFKLGNTCFATLKDKKLVTTEFSC